MKRKKTEKSTTEKTVPYESGADMWRDYQLTYGDEAQSICNRYLDMQICNTNPEELQFCRELYFAMNGSASCNFEENEIEDMEIG